MKKIVLAVFTFTFGVISGAETEKIVKTKPEKIIVYTQGAQIHRSTSITLQPGPNTIVFSGLENCINTTAIQASGSGNFIIADTQYEVYYPELEKSKNTGDLKYRKLIKQINDSIKELNFLLEEIQSKVDVLSMEKNVLLGYSLYKGQSKKDSIAMLKEGLTYLREKLNNINSEQFKLKKERIQFELKLTSLNERIGTINSELANANPSNPTEKIDYRIILNVIADQLSPAVISLNYYITNAGWSPSYDLRASSNEQTIKLTHKAMIHQQSGNDWSNVKLILSTANPNRSYVLPNLNPWYLSNYKPQRYTNQPAAGARYNDKMTDNLKKYETETSTISDEYIEAKQAYNYTTVSENLIETEYEIKLNYNIPSDGKTHYAAILSKDLKTLYRYKAIPKLNSNVYLTALLPNWEDAIMIAGQASIYYDGSFVGSTTLSPAGTDDTLQLSLGIDKNIAIKRQKVKDKCHEKMLDNDKVHQFYYEITVRNGRTSKIEIEIEDQLPITQDKNIVIEQKDISNAKFDELTGLLKWRFNIAAKDSKKINFVYQIKAPKTMPLAFN